MTPRYMIAVNDPLFRELQTLAVALAPHNIPVIIGGGYGLLLRQRHVENQKLLTLYGIPEARSTQDLHLFLSVELIADAERMLLLRDVLHQLGYAPVERAKYYQFQRTIEYGGGNHDIKVDLLAPPPLAKELRAKVKMDHRRIRPKATPLIHAHTTPEAFSVSEMLLDIELEGEASATVSVPHSFTYLLLKLFAYRDRMEDAENDYGRYHAFDLFRIVAMMSEEEVKGAHLLCDRYANNEIVIEAGHIAEELFADIASVGIFAILEHSRIVEAGLSRKDVMAFSEYLCSFFETRGSKNQSED